MVKVRVPATSANIGTGFDCLGIALTLYNTYTFEETEQDGFVGFAPEFSNKGNLVYTSMMEAFKQMGISFERGITIGIEECIPISRGLGSSAVCIVGGVAGANALAGNRLSDDEVLTIAASIEGHPDNIAPAIFGGMTVSIKDGDRFYANKIKVSDGLKFYALIPNFRLETKAARAALPTSLSFSDAVHNVGRSSMLISVMQNGQFELLETCLSDKLHQPYRKSLIPGYEEIQNKCREFGSYGTFISGAGPTIMTLVSKENTSFESRMADCFDGMENGWRIVCLDVDDVGVCVEK